MISNLYVKSNGKEYTLDNEGIQSKDTEQDIKLTDIQATLNFLKTALNFIKSSLSIQEAEVDNSGTAVQTEDDLNISTAISSKTGKQSFVAKSILMTDSEIANTHVDLNASENICIANLNTTGTLAKSISNAGMSLNPASGEVVINGGNYAQNGYNAIEIGLNSKSVPKSVSIKDIDFTSTMSNNAILIFNTADNAVINIENCHFNSVSNVVRLSNRDNVHVTLNIKNCTIDHWDTNDMYAGMVILEDYTNKTAESITTANLFGPDKVTINIENCTGPYGKIKPVKDIGLICGTRNHETQVIYVCQDHGDYCLPYDAEKYPTINIK